MTATVIPLSSRRRNHAPARTCRCNPGDGFTCYPHRLVELAQRIESTRTEVEQFRTADWGTFERLTNDALEVIASITDECLPDERTAR